MAGKVFTAIVDIAGSLNPNVKKSIEKANKQMGALKVGVAAAGAAFAAASVAAGKYLLDLGDQFDSAQDGIRIGTGATGAALDSLMSDFDQVYKSLPTSTENAALAISDLNTKLNLQGKELQDVSKKAIYLSENLGAGELSSVIDSSSKAFQSWNVNADDMGTKMDYVFKVSQSTGAGFNSLMGNMQQYGSTLRSIGYDFETSTALIGQMEKAGVNVSEALGAMKKSLSTMAKEGINASDGFQQYYDNIYNATSATEAANIAAEFFGARAGPEMASAIRSGKLSAGELTAALLENGETIDGLAKETFDYKESLKIMKNTMNTALRPLANSVFSSLGEAIPYVQDLFTSLLPAVGAFGASVPVIIGGASRLLSTVLPPAINLVTAGFGLLQKGIEKLKPFISIVGEGLTKAMQTTGKAIQFMKDNWGVIAPIIAVVTAGLVGYKVATLAVAAATKAKTLWDTRAAITTKAVAAAQMVMNLVMSANPIGLVVAAIAALIAGGILLYKNWDKVTAKAKALWKAFSAGLDKMGAFGAGIKGMGKALLNSFTGIFKNVKGVFTGLVSFVKNIFTGNWKGAFEAAKSVAKNAFGALVGIIKAPLNIIGGFFDGIKTKLGGFSLAGIFEKMGPVGEILAGLTNGWFTSISGAITNIKGVFTGIVDFVKNVFTGNWSGAWDAVKSIVVNAFQGLTGILKAPLNGIIGMINAAISKINGVGFTIPDWVPVIGGKAFSVNIPEIPMFATGGIATRPSIVGEGGYDEYVITTDPKYRSRNIGLLDQAAGALGFDRLIAGLETAPERGTSTYQNSNRPIQVTFAPKISVQSGDGRDIMAQLRAQFPDFIDMVQQALAAESEGSYETA